MSLSKEQLLQVLDQLPGTLLVFFDEDLQVSHWKGDFDLAEELFGGPEELKELSNVRHPPWKKLLPDFCKKILEEELVPGKVSAAGKQLMIQGRCLKGPGKQKSGVLILQAYGSRDEYRSNIDLEREIEEAEESSEIKSRFMASISHEIRTPLNAIIGFVEQLQKTELDERQRKFLNIVDKSSVYLLDLVNEILTFSKIESGEQKLNIVDFHLESLCQDLYQTFSIRAREKNINFRFSFDDHLGMIFRGDSFRLKQIIINLISNAIKFTEFGYVDLSVKKLETSDQRVWIRIRVADTGIGISEAKIQEVFKEYKQASAGIARKHGGTGLGLTISKRLTELMGGKISLKSKEGKGSVFTVDIPLEKSQKQFLSKDVLEINQEVLSGRKALIVDDDAMNRLLGEIILEGFNVQVQLASDGNEAIGILEQEKFDIILLDIHMPELSGLDVARYIRKNIGDKEVKILAVTADMVREKMDGYLEEGIDDYIFKPFREASMFNKLCQMLDVDSQLIHRGTVKIDLKSEPEFSLYNLEELRSITRGNPDFFNEMLRTFIDNALEGIRQIRNAYEDSDWENIGEISHRLIPSYKHLSVDSVVSDLIELKNRSGAGDELERMSLLIDRIEKRTNILTKNLRKEIIRS